MVRKVWTFGLVLWVFPFIAVSSLAQITFERTYGGSLGDFGHSVQQTADGGYIITGGTASFGAGGSDVYLVKTDSLGDTLWTKAHGGTADEWSVSIQQTLDRGYILVGNRDPSLARDFFLLKTDSLGDTLWVKNYGGLNDYAVFSVQQTSDGGYVIAGCINCWTVLADVFLLKTDSLGDSLWSKTYGGASEDEARSVQQTSDGGFVITGFTDSFGAGRSDVYLIKTDSSGDTLWTKTYGRGTYDDVGRSIQETTDGGYIIVGYTIFALSPTSTWDIYLVKTDSLGDTLWTKTIGDSLVDDLGWFVQQTSDGGYILVGWTGPEFGPYDVLLLKLDSLGDTLWTRIYGGPSNDQGTTCRQTLDGGYIIAGGTSSFGAGSGDVYLIKTDGNGQVVGVEEERSKFGLRNVEFGLLQNKPNPYHRSTVIGYSISVHGSVTLKVYDITGSLVETLVEKSQEPGVYQVQWEGKGQASGIYFYRLQSSNFTATKKLIILR